MVSKLRSILCDDEHYICEHLIAPKTCYQTIPCLTYLKPAFERYPHFCLMREQHHTQDKNGEGPYLMWTGVSTMNTRTTPREAMKSRSIEPKNEGIDQSEFSQWKLWQLPNVSCGGKHSLLTVRHNLCLGFRFNVWLSTYSDLRSQYITTNK